MAGFLGVKSAKLFEAQATVVAVDEHLQGRPEIGEGLVDLALEHLLLQGLPEALDDAVGLGLADISPPIISEFKFHFFAVLLAQFCQRGRTVPRRSPSMRLPIASATFITCAISLRV